MTMSEPASKCLTRHILSITVSALLGAGVGIDAVAPASAYEVWLTDQSDTAKESGGFLYIYDGAALAESRTLIAQQFGLNEQQVRQIEKEGLDNGWPPLCSVVRWLYGRGCGDCEL